MGPFDQKALGFKTFKDYLRSLGDRLSIKEPAGSDILVSLGRRDDAAEVNEPLPQHPLRSEIWLAFTNPDPQRLRFYNKSTRRIEHGPASDGDDASHPAPDRVPVVPIEAARQSAWMLEFVAHEGLGSDELLQGITKAPYSSAVNTAFSKALGKKAPAWRRFRASKVFAEVGEWASRNNISFSSLQEIPNQQASSVVSGQSLSPRLRATKLLESFSDQELVDLVIPILAASALVKSRA